MHRMHGGADDRLPPVQTTPKHGHGTHQSAERAGELSVSRTDVCRIKTEDLSAVFQRFRKGCEAAREVAPDALEKACRAMHTYNLNNIRILSVEYGKSE